jgi:hypothetical protein
MMKNVYVLIFGEIDRSQIVGIYASKELADQKLTKIIEEERVSYKKLWDERDSHDPFYKNDFEYYFNSRFNRGAGGYDIETHEILDQ